MSDSWSVALHVLPTEAFRVNDVTWVWFSCAMKKKVCTVSLNDSLNACLFLLIIDCEWEVYIILKNNTSTTFCTHLNLEI